MRGWSFRLAGRIATVQGRLAYANLAARGATTRDIVERQLARAIAMRPDLATVFSGHEMTSCAPASTCAHSRKTCCGFRAELRAAGATRVTFTLPDLTPLLPLARGIAPRILAMNDAAARRVRRDRHDAARLAALPLASDARLWNEDRIHANPNGHERICAGARRSARAAGQRWRMACAASPPLRRSGDTPWRELKWYARYLVPWTLGALIMRGASALGAGPAPSFPGRRPELKPFS